MQIDGAELTVGMKFTTIDGIGGVVSEIIQKKKGWRQVFVEGDPTPYCIFNKETLDVPDD